jgi:hypothetical protein
MHKNTTMALIIAAIPTTSILAFTISNQTFAQSTTPQNGVAPISILNLPFINLYYSTRNTIHSRCDSDMGCMRAIVPGTNDIICRAAVTT